MEASGILSALQRLKSGPRCSQLRIRDSVFVFVASRACQSPTRYLSIRCVLLSHHLHRWPSEPVISPKCCQSEVMQWAIRRSSEHGESTGTSRKSFQYHGVYCVKNYQKVEISGAAIVHVLEPNMHKICPVVHVFFSQRTLKSHSFSCFKLCYKLTIVFCWYLVTGEKMRVLSVCRPPAMLNGITGKMKPVPLLHKNHRNVPTCVKSDC